MVLSIENILSGRKAVNAYREAHSQLNDSKWYKGVPEAHTPLLNMMLTELDKQGFKSIDEFFTASDKLNLEEAGLIDVKKFTLADKLDLNERWH